MMLKKFVFYIIALFVFFTNGNIVLANETSALINIKNSSQENVKNIVEFYARQTNMPEVTGNSNYTYVTISSQKNDFWVALYEQNDNNVCFYIYSPTNKSNVLKDLKIRFKKNNLKYSNVHSKTLKSLKKQDVQKIINKHLNYVTPSNKLNENTNVNNQIISNNTNSVVYDFSDEAQALYDANIPQNTSRQINKNNHNYEIQNASKKDKNVQNEKIKQGIIEINQYQNPSSNVLQQGITLYVTLQSSINTSSLDENDMLTAQLKEDVVIGNKVIPAGSLVYGTVTKTDKAGGAYKNGGLTIKFHKILTLEGNEFSFNAKPIQFKNTNSSSSRATKISGRVIAATLIGVAFSALTGAICDTDNWGRTLTIGAATGAVSGGLSLIGANGVDVEIKEGTVLTVITE